jgi:hypothetical protein
MAAPADFWTYAGLALRKWTSMVLTAVGLIGFVAKLAYPTFPLPQWVYLLIAFVGVVWAGYQVYRDVAPPRQLPPPPYELLPRSFDIYLGPSSARIQVWLYGVNYQAKELRIELLQVTGFRLSGCESLDPISPEGETHIPAKQSRLILCNRRLLDAEARQIAASQPGSPANASFSVTSKAFAGSKHLRWESTQLSSNGSVQGTAQTVPTIG